MKTFDLGELLVLAAIWGSSFLFMRLGAHDFGALTMAGLRVGVAGVALLPLLARRVGLAEARREWRALLLLGIVNNALPFACYAFAAQSITAGLASILNATTPLWGALVAWLWLGQALTPTRVFGMAVGFGGVVFLAWPNADFKAGGSGWAVLACLAATLCYGVGASFSKRYLAKVDPLTVATGSQFGAAAFLLVPALVARPEQAPPWHSWLSLLMLALLCTSLAYILYFRLMQRVGPTNTIAVTFLVPVFAVLWGAVFLSEPLTPRMLAGCAVVLVGTALALGVLRLPRFRASRAPLP